MVAGDAWVNAHDVRMDVGNGVIGVQLEGGGLAGCQSDLDHCFLGIVVDLRADAIGECLWSYIVRRLVYARHARVTAWLRIAVAAWLWLVVARRLRLVVSPSIASALVLRVWLNRTVHIIVHVVVSGSTLTIHLALLHASSLHHNAHHAAAEKQHRPKEERPELVRSLVAALTVVVIIPLFTAVIHLIPGIVT